MTDWEYYWTAQNGEDLETRQKFPYLVYMRTRWEGTSDGMSKPHVEALGLICYRETPASWDIYVKGNDGLFSRHHSLVEAKEIVEHYHKTSTHDG